MKILKNKIKKNKFKVGVFGLGYVGLPLLIELSKKKIDSYGLDIDRNKINLLKKNKSYISDVKEKELKILNKNNLVISKDISKKTISLLDVMVICVPTPLIYRNKPDMSAIIKVLNKIKKFLRENQLLILESTVYPGATENILVNGVKKNFSLGKNFFIGYSPERIDPGTARNIKYWEITKLVSGHTKNCLELVASFYNKIFRKIYKVESIKVAEFSKLYENSYRSVNIGLVNELKTITEKLGINFYQVINAAKTKPFGFMPFLPGPGVGGHCIPIDPIFISWIAKKNKINANFIELSRKTNLQITSWVKMRILKHIESKKNKILLMGMAYKKDVNDARESPSITIFNFFKKKKFLIDYYDPLIEKIKINKMNYQSILIKNYKILKKYDEIIIATDHSSFKYDKILKYSKKIYDCRGVYCDINDKKIVYC
jgi:UDP-N-acetyl-D-glucosamine dehydrogenase